MYCSRSQCSLFMNCPLQGLNRQPVSVQPRSQNRSKPYGNPLCLDKVKLKLTRVKQIILLGKIYCHLVNAMSRSLYLCGKLPICYFSCNVVYTLGLLYRLRKSTYVIPLAEICSSSTMIYEQFSRARPIHVPFLLCAFLVSLLRDKASTVVSQHS